MSRSTRRQGTKSGRRNSRTVAREKRREAQYEYWFEKVVRLDELEWPKNIARRLRVRGR